MKDYPVEYTNEDYELEINRLRSDLAYAHKCLEEQSSVISATTSECSNKLVDTKTIPHIKFTIPLPWNPKSKKSVTYYIGGIKRDGLRGFHDFQVHEKIEGNDDGYGGATLSFLMEDGSTEEVKGPFHKHAASTSRILHEILLDMYR